MKVKITKHTRVVYEIETEDGEPLGEFDRSESWNGLRSYCRGLEILVTVDSESELFGWLSDAKPNESNVATVISATDDLRKVLYPKQEPSE